MGNKVACIIQGQASGRNTHIDLPMDVSVDDGSSFGTGIILTSEDFFRPRSYIEDKVKDQIITELAGRGVTSTRPDVIIAGFPPSRDFYWTLQTDSKRDEFDTGGIETGEIGNLGWSVYGNTVSELTSETDHNGIRRLNTTATANNICALGIGSTSGAGAVMPTQVQRCDFLVRIPSITDARVRVGLGANLTSGGNFGGAGILFMYDPLSDATDWHFITDDAAVTDTDLATPAVSNNWILLSLVRTSIGDWEARINDSLKATHTANIPTAAMNLGLSIETLTTSAKNVDIDWCHYSYVFQAQRWT